MDYKVYLRRDHADTQAHVWGLQTRTLPTFILVIGFWQHTFLPEKNNYINIFVLATFLVQKWLWCSSLHVLCIPKSWWTVSTVQWSTFPMNYLLMKMERSSTLGVSVSLLLLLKSRLVLRILSWLTSCCFDPVSAENQDVRRVCVYVKRHRRFFSKDWREKMLSQFNLARRRTSNVPWWCGLMARQSYSHLPAFNSHSMRLASVSIHLSVKWLPRGPPVSIHCCINHQSSYGCSTGGYYIMPIAANALQQACLVCFLPPACSSAVLRASSLNPGSVPAGGGRLWPQTAAASLSLSGGLLATIIYTSQGFMATDEDIWNSLSPT